MHTRGTGKARSRATALSRRQFFIASGVLLAGCGARGGEVIKNAVVWGGEGLRDGSFVHPRAMGAHGDEVYVIDMSGRVQVFSRAGKFLRLWEMPEHAKGTPTSLAFDGDRVIIPDTHYSRVIEYTPTGEERLRWGSYGSGPDQFIYPTGIALTADKGYLFSEYGQDAERVHVFGPDHAFKQRWGTHGEAPGQFSRAMGIGLHPNGRIYVADTANHRAQVFNADGSLVLVFGNDPAKGPTLHYPQGLAIGPDGSIFLSEYGAHRVSRYAPDGRFLAAYGRAGRGPGELNAPRGVTVDAQGIVYVADTDNHRVQVFDPGGAA